MLQLHSAFIGGGTGLTEQKSWLDTGCSGMAAGPAGEGEEKLRKGPACCHKVGCLS